MSQNIIDAIASETEQILQNAVDDIFINPADSAYTAISSAVSGIDIGGALNNIGSSTTAVFSTIQTSIQAIIDGIISTVSDAFEIYLDVQNLAIYLATLVGILSSAIQQAFQIKITFEILAPVFQHIKQIIQSLLVLKTPLKESIKIRFKMLYEEAMLKYNLKKTKYLIRDDINTFKRSVNITEYLFTSISSTLLFVIVMLIGMIYESRRNISKSTHDF